MSSSSFSIERVVTLLTPIFAAGCAALAGWLSSKLGVHVDATTIAVVMSSAMLATVGIVAKWLHGRQIPEIAGLTLSSAQVDQIRAQVGHHLAAVAPPVDAEAVAQQVIARLASGVSMTPSEAPAPQVAPPAPA